MSNNLVWIQIQCKLIYTYIYIFFFFFHILSRSLEANTLSLSVQGIAMQVSSVQ